MLEAVQRTVSVSPDCGVAGSTRRSATWRSGVGAGTDENVVVAVLFASASPPSLVSSTAAPSSVVISALHVPTPEAPAGSVKDHWRARVAPEASDDGAATVPLAISVPVAVSTTTIRSVQPRPVGPAPPLRSFQRRVTVPPDCGVAGSTVTSVTTRSAYTRSVEATESVRALLVSPVPSSLVSATTFVESTVKVISRAPMPSGPTGTSKGMKEFNVPPAARFTPKESDLSTSVAPVEVLTTRSRPLQSEPVSAVPGLAMSTRTWVDRPAKSGSSTTDTPVTVRSGAAGADVQTIEETLLP